MISDVPNLSHELRYLYFSATPISLIIERVFLLVYCLVELFYSESVEMKNVKKYIFEFYALKLSE